MVSLLERARNENGKGVEVSVFNLGGEMTKEELISQLDDFQNGLLHYGDLLRKLPDDSNRASGDAGQVAIVAEVAKKRKELNAQYGHLGKYISKFAPPIYFTTALGDAAMGARRTNTAYSITQLQRVKGKIHGLNDREFMNFMNSVEYKFTKSEVRPFLEKVCLYSHPLYYLGCFFKFTCKYKIGRIFLAILTLLALIVTILGGYEDAWEKSKELYEKVTSYEKPS